MRKDIVMKLNLTQEDVEDLNVAITIAATDLSVWVCENANIIPFVDRQIEKARIQRLNGLKAVLDAF